MIEPDCPDHTCAQIDEVQSTLEEAADELRNIAERLKKDTRWGEDAHDQLETLRTHNEDLRKWGQWWKDKHEEDAEDHEKQIKEINDHHERRVLELEDEVAELKRERDAALEKANSKVGNQGWRG